MSPVSYLVSVPQGHFFQGIYLIKNITSHLCNARGCIQMRQTAVFYKADPDYGSRVAKCLGLDINKVKRLAGMPQEEQVKATQQGG